jgi:hypothetical protein
MSREKVNDPQGSCIESVGLINEVCSSTELISYALISSLMALSELPTEKYQEERGPQIVIFPMRNEAWKEGNWHYLRT